MSRSVRLLDLLQALRGRRRPVTADTLAETLGVSRRTVYRDIAALVAGGAPIQGEAGLGYVMAPGLFLPPLTFSEDELDALVLGLRLAARRGDPVLATAAASALAKVDAVIPAAQRNAAAANRLLAAPTPAPPPVLGTIRRALRQEHTLLLRYTDLAGAVTEREVWPTAIGFFDDAEVLAAWCTLRHAFRHFRLDRIASAVSSGRRNPRPQHALLAEWRGMLTGTDTRAA